MPFYFKGRVEVKLKQKTGLTYPRRRFLRAILRRLTRWLIGCFGELRVEGLEHLPAQGPVILAANHFHFVDPPLLLAACPRQIEFVAGAQRPNSPGWAQIFPKLWGYIPAFRGGYSRSTLTGAQEVLKQGGVLGIFPEGGSWAEFLRPARTGTAYISALTGAQLVPVSIIGGPELLAKGRSRVTLVFHPAMAAPVCTAKGQKRRAELDAWSDDLMAQIASVLPDEQRGKFSADPDVRAAAQAASDFPFEQDDLRGR